MLSEVATPIGTAVGAGAAAGAIADRDIVAPADAGLGKPPAAGRDMVDEAEGEARMVAPATGFDPVAEADAGDVGLGEAVPGRPAGDTAAGAAEDAAPAPAAGISVVPHCTQNFAPG